MEALINDLRYTFREFRKRPSFTITAVLSLALGIGATSAVFSVIYAVLVDPFPYPHSERMVIVLKMSFGRTTKSSPFFSITTSFAIVLCRTYTRWHGALQTRITPFSDRW